LSALFPETFPEGLVPLFEGRVTAGFAVVAGRVVVDDGRVDEGLSAVTGLVEVGRWTVVLGLRSFLSIFTADVLSEGLVAVEGRVCAAGLACEDGLVCEVDGFVAVTFLS
jgi:hypothetical protein